MNWGKSCVLAQSSGGQREEEEGREIGQGAERGSFLGKLTFHSLHPPALQGRPALAFLPLTTLRHLVGA